jgi:predicted enzyme related to lactoylglutathione lyase
VELQVTDIERAVQFYNGVFGWEVSRPDSSYAVLEAEPVAIGLGARDSVLSGGSVVVIATDDLEGVSAQVVQHGGIVLQPIGPSWRGRQFRFADPDGNQVVVWSEAMAGAEAGA